MQLHDYSFLEKQSNIKQALNECSSNEARYHLLIEWGKKLPFFDPSWKIPEALVSGCQSIMYLHTEMKEGLLFFSASSDALISAGLALMLISLYNEESPETIIKHPPSFLAQIGLTESLTPGRANGLASLYMKMKQEALKHL